MGKLLSAVHGFVWGAPGLMLILGTGLYLSVVTRFAQLRLLPHAVGKLWTLVFTRRGEAGVSAQRALCTALAATVGTGNLVGVAGALCLGGPGAIAWMWVCGLLGMAVKYAEATLAVRYRVRRGGETVGGPMYMITRGMGARWKPLALLYCTLGVLASFGVGCAAQVSAIVASVGKLVSGAGGVPSTGLNAVVGAALALAVGLALLGGVKRIGALAQALVPAASAAYILACLMLLVFRRAAVPDALAAILRGALTPSAVTGGMIGSALRALSVGCARGVFTNEAGMGTAAIAHAAAEVHGPAEQGVMGILEVFLDTIVICTLTALAILCSGVQIPYGKDAGTVLTAAAFEAVYGGAATAVLAAFLSCFAFATIVGWGLYGARCAEFLFGSRAWKPYAAALTAVTALSAVLPTEEIWGFAETMNGLMSFPNLLALLWLSPELRRLTEAYTNKKVTP